MASAFRDAAEILADPTAENQAKLAELGPRAGGRRSEDHGVLHRRSAREGPAHRVRRLHRQRDRDTARGRGRRGGAGRPDARQRPRRLDATGGHPSARRAGGGIGRVVVAAGRRRRRLPPGRPGRGGGAGRRPARLRRPQRPRHRCAPGRDARGRRRPAGAGVVDGRLRRGSLRVPDHGPQVPGPRAVEALDAATSTTTAPSARVPSAGSWSTRTPGSIHAAATPPASSPRSTTRRRGCDRPTPQRWRCATTTSTARACRGTRPTRASRRCSAPRSSAASRRRCSRTVARCATSCTWPTSPAPTSSPCGPSLEEPAGRYAAYNVCSGSPISILDVARQVSAGADRPVEPQVTGGYRLGDVRHIVASPELARRELGFTAQVTPDVRAARVRHRTAACLSRHQLV